MSSGQKEYALDIGSTEIYVNATATRDEWRRFTERMLDTRFSIYRSVTEQIAGDGPANETVSLRIPCSTWERRRQVLHLLEHFILTEREVTMATNTVKDAVIAKVQEYGDEQMRISHELNTLPHSSADRRAEPHRVRQSEIIDEIRGILDSIWEDK